MKKSLLIALTLAALYPGFLLTGCGSQKTTEEEPPVVPPISQISNDPIALTSYANAACTSDAKIQTSGYLVTFDSKSWKGSINHRPLQSEVAYVAPELDMTGNVADVSSPLQGTFTLYQENIDCSAIATHLDIKAIVARSSGFSSDAWTPVSLTLDQSSTNYCIYSYEVPVVQIQSLFSTADQKESGSSHHQLAMVMSGVQDCSIWDNRLILDISEKAAKTQLKYKMALWSSDFGTP